MKKVALIVLFLYVLFMLSVSFSRASEKAADCSIDQGPCTKVIGKTEVTFDISPKPVKAMRDLIFMVSIRDEGGPHPLRVDLSMPGMYMGKNEVILKKEPGERYTGRGIIPRCSSGKSLWQAEIEIPGVGKFSYTFNVTY